MPVAAQLPIRTKKYSFTSQLTASPLGDRAPYTHYSSRLFSSRSIRGSGINQMSAANAYRALAIQELANDSGMAATYSAGDSFPFQSLPTARARSDWRPSLAIIVHSRMKYAIAAISNTQP